MTGSSPFSILAIETATPFGSIALLSGETVLTRADLPEGRQASETILSAVAGVFSGAGFGSDLVTHVAVSAGPGSFTGLRVGMSTAKGFCYGSKSRIVPVPTLHAMALGCPFTDGFVCPVLDARKNEIYCALFRWEKGICRRILADFAIAPDALPERLPPGNIFFCGDGAFSCRALIFEQLGMRAVFPPDGKGRPDASMVGKLAYRLILDGAAADVATLVPFYLRRSEAEHKRKG